MTQAGGARGWDVVESVPAMLTQAIADLLPLAVAIAISPIPVIAIILMLSTPRARTNGPAFAVGWILGLLTVSIVVVVVASGADERTARAPTV